jgi:ABC-type lipopolysaccharide export system ATPase subunit
MAGMIIKTENLTKKYDDLVAVNNLNLEIEEGEIFGLLGPNGAGKTTTILMLLGLTEPSSGKAEIFGRNCTRDPIGVKRVVGYLPDSVAFYDDLTGRENLRFTGELNGIPRKELEERIDTLLKRVGMEAAADKKARTYSRGMTQRLGIAGSCLPQPPRQPALQGPAAHRQPVEPVELRHRPGVRTTLHADPCLLGLPGGPTSRRGKRPEDGRPVVRQVHLIGVVLLHPGPGNSRLGEGDILLGRGPELQGRRT